jgi:site-specific DNA recombinase
LGFQQALRQDLPRKPENEHVHVEVPPIIDRLLFDQVQATLKTQNPRAVAPRVVSGPILLTGLARGS